jgi:hypothetical protein
MNGINIIEGFLNQPFPVWENNITQFIVEQRWAEFKGAGLRSNADYDTFFAVYGEYYKGASRFNISFDETGKSLQLEPFFSKMTSFYNEHGLFVLSSEEIDSNNVIPKLKGAVSVIQQVKPLSSCIFKLVKAIQILRTEHPEVDVSYSHPNIPFTIFVSICEDDSEISNLRVAESIIHEAMHLKLTLIERQVPLVITESKNTYFSPWRDEKRPPQGVLHGAFVFRAVLDFYKSIDTKFTTDKVVNYLNLRREQIIYELMQLKEFQKCKDLTKDGANLIKNLLPLN